jgi:glycosyltransferase involved in cell wall biosynthesis
MKVYLPTAVMKIAHVQHPYYPELGYQENHLPAKQQELGHEVRIFTSDYLPRSSENVGTGWFKYNGVPTVRLKALPNIKSISKVDLRELWRELKQFDPEIIHSHGLHSLYTLQNLFYSYLNDVDLFIDVHIDNDNFHINSLFKWIGFQAHKHILLPLIKQKVKKLLPVNPYAKQFLKEDLGITPSRIELLPLGVDTSVFSPNTDPTLLRVELGIQQEEQVLISSGNLNETKDLGILIRAFEMISEAYPDTRLLIVGPGPDTYLRKVRGLVNETGLDDQVLFCGEVPHEDLPKYYNMADVGVWPGKLGITIIEAIGCGLPVIVCDSIATNFLIANDNGVSFERGDPQALLGSIHQLISNPNEIKRYSDNAVEYAQNRLSWEKVAERSVELYRE